MMTSAPTPLQQTPQKNVSALSILTEVDQYPYRNKLADTYIRSPTSLVSVFFILVFSVKVLNSATTITKQYAQLFACGKYKKLFLNINQYYNES